MKKQLPMWRGRRLPLAGMLLAVLLIALTQHLQAQSPQQRAWDKTLGGSANDYLRSVLTTTDGGYFLAGYSESGKSGDKMEPSRGWYDYWIVRVDASGNKLWDKTLGGNNLEVLHSAIQAQDGGVLLAGRSESAISGEKTQAGVGVWLVKIASNGTKLWDKVLGKDGLPTILAASDGGYVLTGYSTTNGMNEIWIIKIDANGNTLWVKTYNVISEFDGYPLTAIGTTDGGYLLGVVINHAVRLIKTDSAGNKKWEKTITGYYETVNSLIQDDKGDYLIGGYFYGQNDFTQWLLVKTDVNGNKLWGKELGTVYDDTFGAGIVSPGGGYLLSGVSASGTGGGKTDPSGGYWLIETDAAGNRLWDKSFSGDLYDELATLIPSADGGYLLGGYAESGIGRDKTEPNRGGYDYWVVKTTPEAVAPKVVSLTLVNADTDQDIKTIANGEVIDYAAIGNKNITIRANTSPATLGSVVFNLNGKAVRTENIAPYSIGGEVYPSNPVDYYAYPLALGNHTLKATPYSAKSAAGTAGEALEISFTVVDGPTVISYTLINADTDKDIRELKNGEGIDYVAIGTKNINIRANTYPATIGSVVFNLNGKPVTENIAPYSLGGDVYPSNPVDYKAYPLATGSYTLKATPYSASSGGGTAGTALTISFSVTAITTTKEAGETRSSISVHPNPFSDRLSLQVGEQNGNVRIEVVDALGKLRHTAEVKLQAGKAEIKLPAGLPAGAYFILVVGEGKDPQVVKLLKQ